MHEPVLLSQVIEYLNPKRGERYLDATAGYGGHASKILEITQNYQASVLVDRDQMAIDQLSTQFTNRGVRIIHSDYHTAAELLVNQGARFDMILADLGVSSPHLNMASRGFSFRHSGPLDMRMDQRQELTAEEIVNNWPEEDLERIIREYGEEPRYRIISRTIIDRRPFYSTIELANAIASISVKWTAKHPATRTFQALRIAVNDELSLLQKSLSLWVELLESGGRIGIISFHSLEDRIVKMFFDEHGKNRYDADLEVITKKPIIPGNQEVVYNPRSRSAKFRVAAKIKTTERTSDEN